MNFVRFFMRNFNFTAKSLPALIPNGLHCTAPLVSKGFSTITNTLISNPILKPTVVSVVPSCGLKIKGKVRRRCRDCYLVWREGRLYNMCKSFPRHKQTIPVKKEKFTWILTHACQSPLRPY